MRRRLVALALLLVWFLGVQQARLQGGELARNGEDSLVSSGRMATGSGQDGTPAADSTSGFRLLPIGREAYAARLALIDRARRSLDLQYYWFEDDASTRGLLSAVRDAAARGVQVRLLLDDLSAVRQRPLLDQLGALPNLQIRVFNPFLAGRDSFVGRWLLALGDLDRLSRRMHNKMMIADDSAAIVGGRNLTDANFGMDATGNFVDLDLLGVGRVAGKLGEVFDRYWRSNLAVPLAALNGDPSRPSAATMMAFIPSAYAASDPVVSPRMPGTGFIDNGRDLLRVRDGLAHVLADEPDKAALRTGSRDGGTVHEAVLAAMHRARREVVIISPYFVATPEVMATLTDLRSRGVPVRILTSSLAATDQPPAHAAYARDRTRLLGLGIDLHELRAAAASATNSADGALLALHGKAVVIDGRVVFVGSMNFDPLSDDSNTEVGLLVENRMLAAQMLDLFRTLSSPRHSYIVRIAADGVLEWIERAEGPVVVHRREPGASALRRWSAPLLAALVPARLL